MTPPPTLPKSPAVAQRQQQLHLQQYQAQMTVTGAADGEGCAVGTGVHVCLAYRIVGNLIMGSERVSSTVNAFFCMD